MDRPQNQADVYLIEGFNAGVCTYFETTDSKATASRVEAAAKPRYEQVRVTVNPSRIPRQLGHPIDKSPAI